MALLTLTPMIGVLEMSVTPLEMETAPPVIGRPFVDAAVWECGVAAPPLGLRLACAVGRNKMIKLLSDERQCGSNLFGEDK